jgi:hypothetical protein
VFDALPPKSMSSLDMLRKNFVQSENTTTVYDRRVTVTHPISIFGLGGE